MKALINLPEDVVVEAIEGLVASHSHLGRLDGFPSIKVVYDLDFNGDDHVAVISGGGSGHEPAFAGFVGAGMLAAAVAGDVFAAPPEEAVLAAIRQVTGAAGCLLLLMNYTGDRLTFGAAAERAKAEGLHLEMVVVADDCALQGKPAVGRRGIAGSALVAKIAGAAAAAPGSTLAATKAAAAAAAAAVGTMGCSLTTCALPGQEPSQRLGPDEMEFGLGIHGEPGAFRAAVRPVDEVITELVNRIAQPAFPAAQPAPCAAGKDDTSITSPSSCSLPVHPGQHVAVLVNNLGCATALEMSIAAGAAIRAVTQGLGAIVDRIFVGGLITSLDMHGLSVSLLRLDQDGRSEAVLAALDAPTAAPAWPRGGSPVAGKAPAPVPRGATDTAESDSGGDAALGGEEGAAAAQVRRCIAAACEAISAAAPELDALDAAVGDGDCGSTLAKGAAAVHAALGRLPLGRPSAAALALARLAGGSMGGTSGALFKILFAAAGAALAGHQGPLTTATSACPNFIPVIQPRCGMHHISGSCVRWRLMVFWPGGSMFGAGLQGRSALSQPCPYHSVYHSILLVGCICRRDSPARRRCCCVQVWRG